MKYIIWLIVSIYLIPTQLALANQGIALGAPDDQVIARGALESIINIVVINDNQLKEEVPDIRLQSTPGDGSRIARVYCDNNNFNGFSLTFESDRGGKLMLYKNNEFPDQIKEGNYIQYKMDVLQGESGTLGVMMPAESERMKILLNTPHELFFDDNITEATHQAELFINLHTERKLSLFKGVYMDTITITIKDL